MKKLLVASFLLVIVFLRAPIGAVFADAYSDCIQASCGAPPSPVTATYTSCVASNSTECHGAVKAGDTVFPSTFVFNPTNDTYVQDTYGSPDTYNDAQFTGRQVGLIITKGNDILVGLTTASQKVSAVGFLANGIQTMSQTRPASSVEYIAYEMGRLHVPGTPEVAYAADNGGLGFKSLAPVLQLWTLTRNLAYVIFAIIFVIIGVMIMTRQKIDPKTVASIQNALPKIIFSLILVTFSYAIAGFLIDLMYVSLGLLVAIFSGVNAGAGGDLKTLLSGSIFNFVFTGTGLFGTALGVAQSVASIVDGMLGLSKAPGANGSVFGLISGGLAFLIVAIAIIIALFKTWLVLINAYANIILGIIFAPLRLMMDAIPGQNQFSNWLKDMLVNLLTFPLVTVLLAIGAAIATNFGRGLDPTAGNGFVPPLLGVGNQQAAQAFVGLGILLTIPKALDILREALKAPAFKFGSAWMESINPARGAVQMGTTEAGSRGYKYAGNEFLGNRADVYREEYEKFKKGGGPAPKDKSRLTKFAVDQNFTAKKPY